MKDDREKRWVEGEVNGLDNFGLTNNSMDFGFFNWIFLEEKMNLEQLKRDLFNILVYIVEDTIKDDDIDKIIDKQIMPAIEKYIQSHFAPKNKRVEKLLWNLLDGCISRDEVFGGCTLEEYADSLLNAFGYFFPNKNICYDYKLKINGKTVGIEEILRIMQKLWNEGAHFAIMDKTNHYIRFRINLRRLAHAIYEKQKEKDKI